MAIIRHRKAMRAEVRFRWSQEVIAGNKLIRGGMETEPCDNSSISFRQPPQKIAQIEISLVGENRLRAYNKMRNAPIPHFVIRSQSIDCV